MNTTQDKENTGELVARELNPIFGEGFTNDSKHEQAKERARLGIAYGQTEASQKLPDEWTETVRRMCEEGDPRHDAMPAQAEHSALERARLALDGDSGDEEHDALYALASAYEDVVINAGKLAEALRDLVAEVKLHKLNIRKDFSLINAHASATKALKAWEAGQMNETRWEVV